MAVSVRDVYSYIVSTLENDATLQALDSNGVSVYSWRAPEDKQCPYIILERQSGTHAYTMQTEAYQRHWIFVKSVTTDYDGGALGRQILDRVHELITNTRPEIASGTVLRIQADTDLEYVETTTGNTNFYHVGTVFKFWLGNN